jgi:hypothetical protein
MRIHVIAKVVVPITVIGAMLSYSRGSPLPNYHGIAEWFGTYPNKGAKTYSYVWPGTAADWPSGGHINQTLWEGSNSDPTGQYWTEIGYTHGWKGQNITTWYWADSRPNGGGYHDHKLSGTVSNYTWHWLTRDRRLCKR